jgi:ABC-2 type transport system permease protein
VLMAAVIVGTSGWFFFYAIFALQIRRNDAFNTVTSIFYFVFLFASSMFYPLDPLPAVFRQIAYANPITWQVDVMRYATVGVGDTAVLVWEAAAFVVFTIATFAAALWSLHRQE